MSGDGTRIGDLPEETGQVIRALAALDGHGVSVDELAACVDRSESEVRVSVDALLEEGWLATVGAGRYTLGDVANAGIDTEPDELGGAVDPQVVRRRFGEYLLESVGEARRVLATDHARQPVGDSADHVVALVRFAEPAEAIAWLAEHRVSMVAAVQIGAEHGLFELAARLAAAVWEVAPEVDDLEWWRDLSRWGEEAAIGWQNPPFLAALLHHSARVFRRVDEFRAAEGQWVRALRVARQTKDDGIAVRVLESLGELYEVWHRPHRKLDALFDLLAWYRRAERALDAARVRVRIGSTMLAADRADAAVKQLSQADREFDALGASTEREHIDAVIELGRALWRLGAHGRARRCFHQALALLVDRDPAAADVVRELLRTDVDEPLPTHPTSGSAGSSAADPSAVDE